MEGVCGRELQVERSGFVHPHAEGLIDLVGDELELPSDLGSIELGIGDGEGAHAPFHRELWHEAWALCMRAEEHVARRPTECTVAHVDVSEARAAPKGAAKGLDAKRVWMLALISSQEIVGDIEEPQRATLQASSGDHVERGRRHMRRSQVEFEQAVVALDALPKHEGARPIEGVASEVEQRERRVGRQSAGELAVAFAADARASIGGAEAKAEALEGVVCFEPASLEEHRDERADDVALQFEGLRALRLIRVALADREVLPAGDAQAHHLVRLVCEHGGVRRTATASELLERLDARHHDRLRVEESPVRLERREDCPREGRGFDAHEQLQHHVRLWMRCERMQDADGVRRQLRRRQVREQLARGVSHRRVCIRQQLHQAARHVGDAGDAQRTASAGAASGRLGPFRRLLEQDPERLARRRRLAEQRLDRSLRARTSQVMLEHSCIPHGDGRAGGPPIRPDRALRDVPVRVLAPCRAQQLGVPATGALAHAGASAEVVDVQIKERHVTMLGVVLDQVPVGEPRHHLDDLELRLILPEVREHLQWCGRREEAGQHLEARRVTLGQSTHGRIERVEEVAIVVADGWAQRELRSTGRLRAPLEVAEHLRGLLPSAHGCQGADHEREAVGALRERRGRLALAVLGRELPLALARVAQQQRERRLVLERPEQQLVAEAE